MVTPSPGVHPAAPGVHADREVCVGAGMCVLTAPGLFDQDDDGIVVQLTQPTTAGDQDLADRAVLLCPSGALHRR